MFKYTAYTLSTTLKSITCLTVFKYMGVYVPTVFVQIFKHMYITYMLAARVAYEVTNLRNCQSLSGLFHKKRLAESGGVGDAMLVLKC
jgi:hypothetical protein